MRIIKTNFKGLLIYDKKSFKDNRGYFRELYIQKHFKMTFPFDVMSYSKKNVLRGLHLQQSNPQAKLITVLCGKVFDVCVDCRKNSKTFGLYQKFILSSDNFYQILIPPGYGNAYLTLSNFSIYHYKQTQYYSGSRNQFTFSWKDPRIKLNLSVKKPIVSKRDNL